MAKLIRAPAEELAQAWQRWQQTWCQAGFFGVR
jgi:hypothetical protein